MKRGTFKRPVYERPPRQVLRAGPEFQYGAEQRVTRLAVDKHVYVRSEALMKAYRMIPCQHCGAMDGTVCGAHSNWHPHHKGGAIKADDNRCASLCFNCHSMIDQGDLMQAARKAIWWRAHVSTLVLLVKHGIWPRDVPFPDIEVCPW